MRCGDFKSFLSEFCGALSNAGATKAATCLEALYPILDAQPLKSVASIVSKLEAHENLKQPAGAQYAFSDLEALRVWFETFGKPAAAKDLSAMLRLLRTMQVGDVPDFVGRARLIILPPLAPVVVAPREEVVARYCERLEAALGDDQRFSLIVKEFDNDAEVSTNELLLIAKRFGLSTTKSRTAAVKKIRSRHQAVLTSRAKSSATSGRIAG